MSWRMKPARKCRSFQTAAALQNCEPIRFYQRAITAPSKRSAQIQYIMYTTTARVKGGGRNEICNVLWRQKILPPDNIKQIYHGARLIWERASEQLADTTLRYYRFTKNGLLCPYVISRGTDKEAKFFNVHGQNIFTVSFSNFLDDNESASFLWNDTPLYGVHVLNDGAIVESETAWYIEGGETAESFICHTFAPELTDTVEQWGNIFSKMSNYLFAHPNRPNFNGGGGMIPMHFLWVT